MKPIDGYYFKPDDPADLKTLRFLCFNERGFYAGDASANAPLLEGGAGDYVEDVLAPPKEPREPAANRNGSELQVLGGALKTPSGPP